MLGRITAPHFVAGVVLEDDVVVRAAPIIKYMRGWNSARIKSYTRKKGWWYEFIEISG